MVVFKRFFFVTMFLTTAFNLCFSQANWRIDSLPALKKRIQDASFNRDNPGILKIYFSNYFSGISSWSASDEDFDRVLEFLDEGIAFAKSVREPDYVALGLAQKALVFRKKGDTEQALGIALSATFETINNDSIRTIVLIELGDCYQARNEFVDANKNYNKAFDIALENQIHSLEYSINFSLANLSYRQGDSTESKKYLYRNVLAHQKINDGERLIDAYTQLARVTDNTAYLDTVFSIAHTHKLEEKTLPAKKILLAIYGFVKKDIRAAISYMNTQEDLKHSYTQGKGGVANYYFYLGQLYIYNDLPDSALYYIKLAEEGFLKDSNLKNLEAVTRIMADCYEMKNDHRNAVLYYQKSLDFSRQLGNLPAVVSVSNSLSSLYETLEDYKQAYAYKLLTSNTKDTLARLSKEKDLVLMDIYRETKKHEEEQRLEAERLHKKHNLQYMGITISICVVFLSFLILGMFPVSKLVIKIFGFISFICLFEFIILLIEHSVLHPLTHGDPLKLWLLKIVLIAMIVPIQQVLEHKLIHYLQSRKLLHARNRLIAKQWVKKKTVLPPATPEETGI